MFGTTSYNMIDDTLNDSIAKLETILQAIKQSGIRIKFSAYLRIDLVAAFPEMMDILLEMGLVSGIIGIESMDENARKCIRKGTSNEKLLNTLETFKKKDKNLRLSSGFIVGLPGETIESIVKSHRWLIEQTGRYLDHWHWIPLTIDRKGIWLTSEFSRNAEKFGYKLDDNDRWTSSTMTFDFAKQLAAILNKERQPYMKVAHFFVSELIGYGYTIDEICSMHVSDVDIKEIEKRKDEIIRLYKEKLFLNSLT